MLKIDVSDQMLKFRQFILDSWNWLDQIMQDHDWDEDVDFIDDWVQVNWEFLVERQLLDSSGRLKPYFGSFANSRITYPRSAMTHQIICASKNGKQLMDWESMKTIESKEDLIFDGFVKKMDRGFGWYPPFDYATVFIQDRKHFYTVHIEYINFYLVSV